MKLTADKKLLEQATVEQLRQNLVLLQAETIELQRMHLLELLITIEALQAAQADTKKLVDALRQENEELRREQLEESINQQGKVILKFGIKIERQAAVLKQAREALEEIHYTANELHCTCALNPERAIICERCRIIIRTKAAIAKIDELEEKEEWVISEITNM
jgi:hypothetical protein